MSDTDPPLLAGQPAAPAWRIGPEHLALAREMVARHALRTPLVPLPPEGTGAWAKLESEQRTGSFKLRGALTVAEAMRRQGADRLVTASAGNHGQGLALAARLLGLEVEVFAPRGTPRRKVEAMEAAGGRLVLVEGGYDEAEARARDHAGRLGLPFVSPFDDPWVAAGNGGTVAEEILADLPSTRRIVLPVGGGGLLAGVLAGLREAGRSDVEVLGVQSAACPAMARSLREGRPLLRLAADGPTLAEGLEGGVSPTTWALAAEAGVRVEPIAERHIATAIVHAWRRLGWRLEGSAAVPLAWLLRNGPAAALEPTVLVLTGRNLDDERLGRLSKAAQQAS